MYIYIVYIQCKHDFCKNSEVSYGYLMVMVWVSYGAGSILPLLYHYLPLILCGRTFLSHRK